jgi:Flp pilus assembly protein TadD
LPLFEQATQLEPGDWKSLYQEGYCLEQLGKLGEARTRYDRAITLVEKSGESFGWPFQGIARLMLDDDPSAALDLARRAVSLEPNEPSNHLLLARVYERLGKLPEAVHEAQLAVAQNSTDAATRYALYKLYRASGDSRAAKELTTFNEITKLYGTN